MTALFNVIGPAATFGLELGPTGLLRLIAGIAHQGVQTITPSANVNNQALSATTHTLVVTPSNDIDLTGIVAAEDGRELDVINASGTKSLRLPHDSTSTNINRFFNGLAQAYMLGPLERVRLLYSTAAARWLTLGVSSGGRWLRRTLITTPGAGTHTYLPYSRVVDVFGIGGGGGSGGALGPDTAVSGGGGHAGWFNHRYARVAATADYVIGAGGAAGAATPTDGSSGVSTTWTDTGSGTVYTALAGAGSPAQSGDGNGSGAQGGGSTGPAGTLLGFGQHGGHSMGSKGGHGGSGPFGQGGFGRDTTGAAFTGNGWGVGAGGARSQGSTGRAGAAGLQGVAWCDEFS